MTTNEASTNPTTYLHELGFTDYEAQAYVTLVESGELTGYELAKRSGIPRANVYAVARKLLDRGAILKAETAKGKHYVAVPPRDLLEDIGARHDRVLKEAGETFARMKQAQHPSSVFNLQGDRLLERARQLIRGCREQLQIAVQPAEAGQLLTVLHEAEDRGVDIVTLCLEACSEPCGGCVGDLYRQQLAPADGSRWLLLVADGGEALVGRVTTAFSEGLVTTQPLVMELVSAYIHQSMALASVGDAAFAPGVNSSLGRVWQWLKRNERDDAGQ